MARIRARHRKVLQNPVATTAGSKTTAAGSKPSKVCVKCLCVPCECKTMQNVPGRKSKKKTRQEARYKEAIQALNNKGGRS